MRRTGAATLFPILLVCTLVQAGPICAAGRERTAYEGVQTAEGRGIDLLMDQAYYRSLTADLARAKHEITIVMYLFKLTGHESALPNRIAGMLMDSHRRGVDVTVVLNLDQKNNLYKEEDDLNRTNLKTAKELEHRGIKVSFDSLHRITHEKVIIIDRRIIYIGSHNLTQSALKYNHEVSVRIVSPALAGELLPYVKTLIQE